MWPACARPANRHYSEPLALFKELHSLSFLSVPNFFTSACCRGNGDIHCGALSTIPRVCNKPPGFMPGGTSPPAPTNGGWDTTVDVAQRSQDTCQRNAPALLHGYPGLLTAIRLCQEQCLMFRPYSGATALLRVYDTAEGPAMLKTTQQCTSDGRSE